MTKPTWDSLRDFVSRPNRLESGNYIGAPDAYRSDRARIARDRKAARRLIQAAEAWGVDPAIVPARRLSWSEAHGWEYCPGQYYPVEVFGAVCRAVADACVAHSVAKEAESPPINTTTGTAITYSPRHHSERLGAYVRACSGPGSELAARWFDWN